MPNNMFFNALLLNIFSLNHAFHFLENHAALTEWLITIISVYHWVTFLRLLGVLVLVG